MPRYSVHARVQRYIEQWLAQGYPDDLPDEVPACLMELAPSYKAICFALMRNDLALRSLGFSMPESWWYGELKRLEFLEGREPPQQTSLW